MSTRHGRVTIIYTSSIDRLQRASLKPILGGGCCYSGVESANLQLCLDIRSETGSEGKVGHASARSAIECSAIAL